MCLIFLSFVVGKPTLSAEISKTSEPAAMEDVIFLFMSSAIYEAMENYYKAPRQYLNPDILSVSQLPGSYVYEIVYQFETFTGAHNPPYGKDTITFWVYNGGIWVKEYEHTEIPALDWWNLF